MLSTSSGSFEIFVPIPYNSDGAPDESTSEVLKRAASAFGSKIKVLHTPLALHSLSICNYLLGICFPSARELLTVGQRYCVQ
jgi:hypothetical protein